MSGITEKIIEQLRNKLKKKSEDVPAQPKIAISPTETAEILHKLKNSWADIEEDKKMLCRFIDEWIDSHL